MASGDCKFTRTEWAQRKDLLFVTFFVEDCKNADVKFEAQKITFHGDGGTPKQKHTSELELFKEIDLEKSTWTQTQRSIYCKVYKKVEESYWPRLLSSKAKQHWLKVDFNRYKDEDDSDDEDAGMPEQQEPDLSQMMAQMGRGGGANFEDFGGDDEEEEDSDDSDDEEIPELETAPAETEATVPEPAAKPVPNGGTEEGLEAQACDA